MGRLRAIATMLAAVFVFAIMDALMKRLSHSYGTSQLSCLRCVTSLAFLSLPLVRSRSWKSLRVTYPAAHLGRGLLGVLMLGSFVYAVRHLSLAVTYSLFLCTPLLVTALSGPFLGERVPARRWAAIAIGFCGVLVILHPTSTGLLSMAGVAAATATVCYSISLLTVRALSRTNSGVAMVFWYLLLVGIGSGTLSVFDWRPIAPSDWLWLAAIGVTGALGQYGVTVAFSHAPASVVAPFEYSAILWAFAIDWLFWSVLPDATLVLGAAIIIGSGLYIIWDEQRMTKLGSLASTPMP